MKLIFAGTPEIASQGLALLAEQHEVVLVITTPDARVGRNAIMTPSPVAQRAEFLNIPVIKTKKVGAEQLAAINETDAQLAVVIAFGALVREPALSAIRWWNLHFSLLPEWRGASPLQHSILSGQGAGVTVFELDEGLDTGLIIAQRALPSPTTSYGTALQEFLTHGVEVLLDALRLNPKPSAQRGEPSFAGKISRRDARIDFNGSADQIERAIRAYNPEPMAWAEFAGTEIRLLRARVFEDQLPAGLAGASTVGTVAHGEQGVLVRCGVGTLEVLELQPAGKRSMPAADWFRGAGGGNFA